MGAISDDPRADIRSGVKVRALKQDASVEEVDRCTQLLLDGLGNLPTLYLQGGSEPWGGSCQSVLWDWMRDRVQVACETGDILIVGLDTSLSESQREQLESNVSEIRSSVKGEFTGTEGIWGVAHRTLPGFMPWEKNGAVSCGQHDDRLTAAEIIQRDTTNESASGLKTRLMAAAGSSIRDSTFLNLLATDSEFRGLGLGNMLFETVAEEAREKGSEMTWFTQTEQNEKMYERWSGECLAREKLHIPGLVSVDESTQTWRVFVQRV